MIDEIPYKTALDVRMLLRGKILEPRTQLIFGKLNLQDALFHVQMNDVPVSDGCQRSANRALRSHVQDLRTEASARHAAVRYANEIFDSPTAKLRRQRHKVAVFRHAGRADRTVTAQYHDGIFRHVRVLTQQILLTFLKVLENLCRSPVLHQLFAGSRTLDDRALRREIPVQNRDAALLLDRIRQRPDDVAVVGQIRFREIFSDGFPVYGKAFCMKALF